MHTPVTRPTYPVPMIETRMSGLRSFPVFPVPDKGAPQAFVESDGRIVSESFPRLGNYGATPRGIVDEIIAVGAFRARDLSAVPGQARGHVGELAGQIGHGDFRSFGADVIGLSRRSLGQQQVVSRDGVRYVAEGPLGAAVRKQGDVAAGQDIPRQI